MTRPRGGDPLEHDGDDFDVDPELSHDDAHLELELEDDFGPEAYGDAGLTSDDTVEARHKRNDLAARRWRRSGIGRTSATTSAIFAGQSRG